MPKPHTFPSLYNEALQIHISKLKGWGYFEPKQIKSGTLNWSRNGEPTGSISIKANMCNEQPFIELDYNYRGEPRNYKVFLTTSASNLNRGEIWFFICPHTKKRCRKLYSIGGYFLHREAFVGCMYETQTQSKKMRFLLRTFGAHFKCDELYSELYKKHFKKTYAGKPTKKYLRLTEMINQLENIDVRNIQKLVSL
jgi:hypothetical protein